MRQMQPCSCSLVIMEVERAPYVIEAEDIIRRSVTSMENLLAHLDLIDLLVVIDNSKADGEIVLEADKEFIKYHQNVLPEWIESIDRHLKNRMIIHK
ncbi:hypothetical protein BVG16_32005 [Paenibacillus selenitireducens]|uniref:Uncharacterized protein n=1 Tax=Paenibacillus selenitireducens TaxID=1324314 RepID=A0A1T2WYV2_9BACL|nr:hypothetical protein [Paenibacillus selenitireducens]OPA72809.1 hypothetical protein BVG16_32005 [Paenibacillus selenitireducens]